MGAYLSSPVCEKETVEGSDERLAFVASSMQGWRMSQEDAHNAILKYDDKTSFFAVYDGHGGAEIAIYCSRHLPDFIKQLECYRNGDFRAALTEGFLKFDALLLEPKVKEVLKALADEKENDDQDDDDENMEDENDDDSNEPSHGLTSTGSHDGNGASEEFNTEEAHLLKKEANLPIEELIKKYGDKTNEQGKHFHSPQISKRKAKNPTKIPEKTNESSDSKPDQTESTGSNETEQDSENKLDETKGIEENQDTIASTKSVPSENVTDTKENGEADDASEPVASSSEPKTSGRRARKTAAAPDEESSTKETLPLKTKSLTHQLLGGDLDDCEEEDDDDEDDSEFNGSDDEESTEEDDDDGQGSDDATGDEDENEEDTGEEEQEEGDEDGDKPLNPAKAAKMKNLMRKSIMAILNKRLKKKRRSGAGDDQNDEQLNDDGNDDNDDDDDDENDDENDDEDDDGDDSDLGKMLDMNNDPGSSSGCTAVVALLHEKELFVANAGDSRCVVCRDGRAIEMSIDHKPEDIPERNRIEKAGYKVTLDGRVSGGLNLSRAIGDHAYKTTASLPAEEQAITALPDIRTLTLDEKDEFMIIACDGIWNSMSNEEAVMFVRERLGKKSIKEICDDLFMHCLAPNTSGDGTGCDNMTAIIVTFNFTRSTKAEADENTPSIKSRESSPWPTMFVSVTNKRALSPDRTSDADVGDENTTKKLKLVENGTNDVTSPTKSSETFSFVTAAAANTNNNNANDDQQH